MKYALLAAIVCISVQPVTIQAVDSRPLFTISLHEVDAQKAIHALCIVSGFALINGLIKSCQNVQGDSIETLAKKYENINGSFNWYGSTGDRMLIAFYEELSDDLIYAQRMKDQSVGADKALLKRLIKKMKILHNQFYLSYCAAYARQNNYGMGKRF